MTQPSGSQGPASGPQFSFFVTSDITVQVQLRVDRLVGRIPAYEDPELAPGGSVRPSALAVTATLCDEHGPLAAPARTHFAEAEGDGAAWEGALTFPSRYRDLGPSSQVALTVWEVREGRPSATPLGGTTLRLFSKKGRLKTGPRALRLWLGREGDGSWPSATPGKVPEQAAGSNGAAAVQRALKKFRRGEMEAVPWLDALAEPAAEAAVAAADAAAAATSGTEEGLRLLVEVPPFPLPVLYQDSVLPAATAAPPAAAVAAGTGDALATPLPGTSGSGVARAPLGGGAEALARVLATGTGRIALIDDPEVGRETPAEAKAQKLARSTGRGLVDTGLRPNTAERARIDAVLAQPPGRPLPRADKELLWRFRFALVGEGRALTRFLKSVDWGDAAEAAQAVELMARWAPISTADALDLLSPNYRVEAVRAHAVAALRPTSDEELLHFLLQLVQALRYEEGADGAGGSRLATFLVDRACASAAVASALFWYLCAELEDPSFGGRAAEVQGLLLKRLASPPPAAGGLRDVISLQLKLVARLRHLADAVREIRSADRKTEAIRRLMAPGEACADLTSFECPCPLDPGVLLLGIVPSECSVFRSKVSPIKVTFKVALPTPSGGAGGGSGGSGGGGASGSAWNPAEQGDSAEEGDLPARLASLNLGRASEGTGEAPATAAAAGATSSSPRQHHAPTSPRRPSSPPLLPPPTTTLSLIYKSGDDLRQDQLVLQLISLMDRLLKREHLDLRITAYQVLPTSATDGLIEFVPGAAPLSQVLRERGSIHRFLARRHPDPKGPYGLDPGVLANYIRSCAGSVVLTHVLGVGDRHMDNVMLTTDGRLFHIDFGYILGRDPKFSTAPLVLTRAMVDGMGGADGPHYRQFVQLCGEAYNILRKNSNLLLSLVHLMAGSSIPDVRGDPEKAMLRVQERLALGVDDGAAAAALEAALAAAQTAVLPKIAEVQHRVAQGWR